MVVTNEEDQVSPVELLGELAVSQGTAAPRGPLGLRWARSGLAALTGWPGAAPPLVPAGVVLATDRLADAFTQLTGIALDGLGLLAERAAVVGLAPAGDVSCGGACRLLPTADGHVALSLARPSDRSSVAAWLEVPQPEADQIWEVVGQEVAVRPGLELQGRAELLGLPLGVLGEATLAGGPAVVTERCSPGRARSLDGALVVDLSALWAGPLCARLLGLAGADVVKVEDPGRPDGARSGHPGWYDHLHGGHRAVALDLRSTGGRHRLEQLLAAADVVIEGSRPRALAQLGIDARAVAAAGPVWVSITGHGRGAGAARVGFGDDTAVAGGLVGWLADRPCFVADAVADPASGLLAAVAVASALSAGGGWLLDLALARTAAALADPRWGPPVGPIGAVEPGPRPPLPPPAGPAAALGADTASVLGELGIEP